MRLAKLAVASVSPTVGAVRSNVSRLIAIAKEMADTNVTIGAFPEQVIGGYPPEDLVQWPGFSSDNVWSSSGSRRRRAESATVYVLGLAVSGSGQIFNAAAVVHRGRIAGVVPKEKLPTYNVFYEGRTFSRGGPGLAVDWHGIPLGDYRFQFDFGDVAVEVCEDAWSPDGPMRRRCYSGSEIVVNVSTSPYRMGVDSTRREMLATRAADNQALLLYANAVGGQDGLIYDGGGFIFQNGRLVFEAPRFVEGWWSTIVDLDRTRRLRMENTTWRSDCEHFASSARRCRSSRSRARPPTVVRSPIRAPTAATSSCPRPPEAGKRQTRAIAPSTICSRPSRSASRVITKRPAHSSHSASRSAADAIPC
jgi:NAD+ synthase (glutamine-hydrolysing)